MARGEHGKRAALTPDGVKRLHDGAVVASGVVVQVLGIYRYLADPAARNWCGPRTAKTMARDAFDLLVSDGQLKMKCLLSPTLHQLVWTRRIHPLSIVSISKFEALEGHAADAAGQRRVCLVSELSVVASVKMKIVRPRPDGAATKELLEFISSDDPREVALLPLVGERRYYLPLGSDHYSLDHDCSFTGERDDWSPSDELIEKPAEQSGVVWTRDLDECPSLFSKSDRRVLTLKEVAALASAGGGARLPPMVGTVSVKSKVSHLGVPDAPGEFPFAFHIVLVDKASAVEVAFYGSMCARLFLGLQEGDLVQLRGCRAIMPSAVTSSCSGSTPLFYLEHNSSGSVCRVPEKYWKMLQVCGVIDAPIPMKASNGDKDVDQPMKPQSPRWLRLSFASSLDTQRWSDQAMEDRHLLHFDFVGVLSFVGKVCRRRRRRLLDTTAPGAETDSTADALVTEYRWVKAIDKSSPLELVILVEECSQPSVFRSLAVGDLFMATKLRWVVLGSADEHAVQYAATSSLSVLRVENAISPFLGLVECRLSALLARSIRKVGMRVAIKTTNSLPANAATFMKVFGVVPMTFSQLRQLNNDLEAAECAHVALVAPVREVVRRKHAASKRAASIFLDLGDLDEPGDLSSYLTVVVAANPLFQPTELPDVADRSSLTRSLELLHVMSPSLVHELRASATREAGNRRTDAEALALSSIREWMTRQTKCFFSLRLFRNELGNVVWEVDAILPAP